MNNTRRKQIKDAINLIERAKDILEEVRDDEQDAFDNMPEGLQESERGEYMEDVIDCLDEQMDALSVVIEEIEGW